MPDLFKWRYEFKFSSIFLISFLKACIFPLLVKPFIVDWEVVVAVTWLATDGHAFAGAGCASYR